MLYEKSFHAKVVRKISFVQKLLEKCHFVQMLLENVISNKSCKKMSFCANARKSHSPQMTPKIQLSSKEENKSFGSIVI
jgi:hypothetical protein